MVHHEIINTGPTAYTPLNLSSSHGLRGFFRFRVEQVRTKADTTGASKQPIERSLIMEVGLCVLVLCAVVNLAVAVSVAFGLRALFGPSGRVLPFSERELDEVLEEINTATGVPADPREVEEGPITACDALVRCRLMLGALKGES